jgi:hypothetical protein
VDFDGGTHSVEVATGTLTATGFDTPTIYVDGSVSSTLAISGWHHVVVTTATGFIASALKIGKETTFFDGKIDDFKIFSRALSATEVSNLYRTRVTTAATLDTFPTNYPADDSTDAMPDHTSYMHVRSINGANTFGTERSFTTAYAGTTPTIANDSIKIYQSDGTTEIVEGEAIANETIIKVKPSVSNYDSASTMITVFQNLNTDESALVAITSPTTEDADGSGNPACVSGVEYADCDSKVWYEMSAAGDYSTTAFYPTISIEGLPTGSFKARTIATNDSMPNVGVGHGNSGSGGWWSFHHGDTGYGTFYTAEYLQGWAHSENAGWIKLYAGTPTAVDCSAQPTQTITDYGVMSDTAGNLCGYGYSETFGWISFMGDGYQVSLTADHQLTGYALSEAIGWVNFDPSVDSETPNLCLFDDSTFGCRFDDYTYEAAEYNVSMFDKATYQ